MGINFYKVGEYEKALELFERSIEISVNKGFTMKTIGVSIQPLLLVTLIKAHNKQQYNNNFKKFELNLFDLQSTMPTFKDYIDLIGGKSQIILYIEEGNIDAIAKMLPFIYS
jgi:tetratricopeptide (TPR) repeat protein